MYHQIFAHHAKLLKAMSHPKRLEIIHLLRDQALTVSEIQSMLDLPQANLSQHLSILREAGVVKVDKQGKYAVYSLSHPNFIKASDLIRAILIERYQNNPLADELTLSMHELVPLTHDPICGMRLSPKTASFALRTKNQTYYFCAEGCYKKFKQTHQEDYES